MQIFNAMPYLGETISIIVAVSWTASALFSEVATKRTGVHVFNVLRMVLSMSMLVCLLWAVTGRPYPQFADAETWMWLLLSGAVGYVFGDYCLFNAYLLIGSRFGQLFMTIAPAVAAIAGWLLMGETLALMAVLGMVVTSLGIGLSILGRSSNEETGKRKIRLNLPTKGVLFGIGSGVGQGLGLVLSAKGLRHYESALASQQLSPDALAGILDTLPFASTFIRAIAGLVGFVTIMLIAGRGRAFVQSFGDRRAMSMATMAVFFGPFFGVSLSLMATQHTSTGIAMTLMSLSPILILWPAYFLFKQPVTWRELLGAVISVVGVSLFFL